MINALKQLIKQQPFIAALLYRIYLQYISIERSGKTFILSHLIQFVRSMVVKNDVKGVVIAKKFAQLTFYDHTFYWNPKDRNSLLGIGLLGTYEQKEISSIVRFLKPGMVVFDIGGNFGLHAMIFAKHVGRAGHVYSFEPLKLIYDELTKNIVLNGYEDTVTANNFGLSDKKGREKIYIVPEFGTGATSLRKRWSGANIVQYCDLLPLDSYVKKQQINKLDFIKCDVEGAELLVFKGGIKTIEKHKPVIFFEAIDNHTKLFDYTVEEELEFLRSLSYELYVLYGTTVKKATNLAAGNFYALTKEHIKEYNL